MKTLLKKTFWMLLALSIAVVDGSAASLPKKTVDRMEAIAGRLLLNNQDLKEIYRDMHGYAEFTGQGQDRQLDYIQKLYLTIDRVRTQGYLLWRFLSTFEYLMDARQSDFLTLYERELKQARSDYRLSVMYIELYAAFIEKKEIRKTLKDAVGIIEANIYMYEQLENLISPYLNEPPYPRSIR